MILREIPAETISSIFAVSQRGVEHSLGTQPSDIRWFLSVNASEPVSREGELFVGTSKDKFQVLTVRMKEKA